MADPTLPDAETERVSMLWPKNLKVQVQTLVGKRKLTDFTVAAVQQALREHTHPAEAGQPGPAVDAHAVAAATPPAPEITRTETDGGETDLGTPITEHMLVAVQIDTSDPLDAQQCVVTLHCRCGLMLTGISPVGDQGDAMLRARAKWEARAETGAHPAAPLSGRDTSAVEWFTDDREVMSKVAAIQDLVNGAADIRVTVHDKDGTSRLITEPPKLVHLPDNPHRIEVPPGEAPPPGYLEDGLPRIKVPYPDSVPTRVESIREKFPDLVPASEIPAPVSSYEDNVTRIRDGITPGDREVPAGDLHFQEPSLRDEVDGMPGTVDTTLTPEAAPTAAEMDPAAPTAAEMEQSAGMCPTCHSPLIDGTCWSCSI